LRALSEMPSIFHHRRRLHQRNVPPDAAAWGVEARFWG
jgi:hypothetical protein